MVSITDIELTTTTAIATTVAIALLLILTALLLRKHTVASSAVSTAHPQHRVKHVPNLLLTRLGKSHIPDT